MLTTTSELHAAALAYVAQGWHVFPCRPCGKAPLTKNGFKDASCDLAIIDKWWSKTPQANIGLACGASGLEVLDVDGIVGLTELTRLEATYGSLPDTLTAITGSGGRHYYFLPTGFRQRAKFAPGLDTRSQGGYTILPPSIHESGIQYAWLAEVPAVLPPDWLRTLIGAKSIAIPVATDLPDTSNCIHVTHPETGSTSLTAWAKLAKKRLKGRVAFDLAFSGVTPPEGSRDTALTSAVGEAITLLCAEPGTSPDLIYALLLPAAERMSDWDSNHEWLWDKVCRLWQQEATKREAEVIAAEAEQKELDNELHSTLDSIIKGMRSYITAEQAPALYSAEPGQWVSEHLIAILPSGHTYTMRPDGRYDPLGVPLVQLPSRVRQLGMSHLITLDEVNAAGTGTIKRPPAHLITDYATHVSTLRGVLSTSAGTITKIDTPEACLLVPTFARRTDLVPTFNKEVDQYLRAAFGPHYKRTSEWFAQSLAFDEGPICALSIVGRHSLGKTLIATGLAECITTETYATAKDLLGEHGYGLLLSPFLWIDEGIPASITRKPADAFRELVGGTKQVINRKYMAPTEMACPRRLIITANNPSVIAELCNNKDMSPEDREAIGIRLLHIDLRDRDDGARWLDERGGPAYTGKEGARWIAGTAGQPSDYILARHFLWLYTQRAKPTGKRFLVQGDVDAPIVEDMRMSGGLVGLTAHMIIEMLNALERKRPLQGIEVVTKTDAATSEIYVTSAQVLSYWQENHSQGSKEQVNVQRIGMALGSLCIRRTTPLSLASRRAAGTIRWYVINPGELYRVAQRHGFPCGALERLVQPTPAPLPNRIAGLM